MDWIARKNRKVFLIKDYGNSHCYYEYASKQHIEKEYYQEIITAGTFLAKLLYGL